MVLKKISEQAQPITAGDMSGNLTSSVINLLAAKQFSIQGVWTGVPVGNLQLEVSNDETNWTDEGSPIATGGAAGDIVLPVTTAPWAFARLQYISTSGTGVLNVFSIIKQ